MRRIARLAALLAVLQVLPSCVVGLVYTHVKVPLDRDMWDTPVFRERVETGKQDQKVIRYYVSVEWDSNAIGPIAKKYGIEEIQYADVETLSVLGLWTQRWVHIYGTAAR
jgi:hypothetical protein